MKPSHIGVSIKKEIYASLSEHYNKNKKSLARNGINSISGYVVKAVNEKSIQEKQLKIFANKITKVPSTIRIPKEYLPLDF